MVGKELTAVDIYRLLKAIKLDKSNEVPTIEPEAVVKAIRRSKNSPKIIPIPDKK